MELQLRRNGIDNIIIGKQNALNAIREHIGGMGVDGTPILVRYKETEDGGDDTIKTLFVILGPNGSYTVFDSEANSGGGKKVTSEDNTVRVTENSDSYDLGILSPAIINYLNNLAGYKYKWTTSSSTKVIDLTIGGTSTYVTCAFDAYRWNTIDGTTESNPEKITVVSSTPHVDGWTKKTEREYTITVTPTEDDWKRYSIPVTFECEATNSDGITNSNIRINASVSFLRWWFIVEHGKDAITEDELNSYINNPNSDAVDKYGKSNASPSGATTWDMKESNYFWVIVPSNQSASVTQTGQSVVDSPIIVGSKFGNYKCYCSKSKQAATQINVDIKIS